MAGALKYRSGGTWNYVKGVKGDMGPAGPPSVGLTTITADKDQGLRWIGNASPQLLFRRNREAIINDRDSIDTTGATALGDVINTYLAEYKTRGINRVYFDAGTYGIGATPVTFPSGDGFTIEGHNWRNYQASPTAFTALTGCTKLFYINQCNPHLRSVFVNQNNIATYGIHVNLSTPELGFFTITGTPDTGTALYGGGLENVWFHDYLIQVSGGTGIGTGVDIIQGNSSTTSTYYGADNRSLIERGAITGNGILMRISGSCRVRDHDFEGSMKTQVAAHVILGQDIVGPNGSGQYVSGGIRFEDNYFELSALGAGYSTIVPVAILVPNSAAAHITGNLIYGGSDYFTPGKGSAAIKFQSGGAATKVQITGNAIARWDIGIQNPASGNGVDNAQLIAANSWPGTQVNTQISGGDYGTKSPSTGTRPSPAYYQTKDGHLFQGGAVALATVWQSGAGSIDFARANITQLDYAGPDTITPVNQRAGQRMTLYVKSGTHTLQTASWRLLSGVDETPAVGTIKEFIVEYDGNVREVGPKAKTPATKTTTFTADAGADVYLCDATTGAITANLPTATTWTGGPLTVKKTDSSANAVTVDPNGTQTVDGATTLALTAQWSAVTMRPSGGNWLVTGKV